MASEIILKEPKRMRMSCSNIILEGDYSDVDITGVTITERVNNKLNDAIIDREARNAVALTLEEMNQKVASGEISADMQNRTMRYLENILRYTADEQMRDVYIKQVAAGEG
jgi:hypothetical protein